MATEIKWLPACVECQKAKMVYHPGRQRTWEVQCDRTDETLAHISDSALPIKETQTWDKIGKMRARMTDEERNMPNKADRESEQGKSAETGKKPQCFHCQVGKCVKKNTDYEHKNDNEIPLTLDQCAEVHCYWKKYWDEYEANKEWEKKKKDAAKSKK